MGSKSIYFQISIICYAVGGSKPLFLSILTNSEDGKFPLLFSAMSGQP